MKSKIEKCFDILMRYLISLIFFIFHRSYQKLNKFYHQRKIIRIFEVERRKKQFIQIKMHLAYENMFEIDYLKLNNMLPIRVMVSFFPIFILNYLMLQFDCSMRG